MGGPIELKGPDFVSGVALKDIPDGGSLLGHARGEPILMVRRGEELFAVGAVCTHYSGPLAEGRVVGESVRCPWHHACFDLRTGAPSAPAMNPIPCYPVARQGSQVVVGEKISAQKPAPVLSPKRVVIVGAGPAGALTAETLRRLGHVGEVVLIGAEETPPIDRPNLSKDYLAGTAPEEWMELRGRDFYREQKIDFRVGARVESIDLKSKIVQLSDGEKIGWEALVLATGAEPVRLKVPGAESIRYLRTLADSRAIIQATSGRRHAVVIGASFIGLEVAASLRTRGVEVSVVGHGQRPLGRVLGPELSDLVREIHESHGVRFHLGRSLKAIEAGRALLDDGTALEADLVVAGVGVRPRTELAERAGLPVDHGILVDREMRAAPDVYAAGDVARWPDGESGERVRIEHWVVAGRHGEAVAHSMLGRPWTPRAPFFWSAHYDVTINYVGHASVWDRLVIDGDLAVRDAALHYYRGDRLLAVATLGRDAYALRAAQFLEGTLPSLR